MSDTKCICDGYSNGWVDCVDCDGHGGKHDCGEDTCCCADPDLIDEEWESCPTCNGDGGWPCPACRAGVN